MSFQPLALEYLIPRYYNKTEKDIRYIWATYRYNDAMPSTKRYLYDKRE